MTSSIRTTLLILCWITCSALTQINNQDFIQSSHASVTLVFCQMLMGLLVEVGKTCLFDSNENKTKTNGSLELTRIKWLLLTGLTNVIGHILTMHSMLLIAPALTHIIRSLEPLSMSLVSFFILGHLSERLQILSLVPMILGMVLFFLSGEDNHFHMSSLHVRGIVIALCANFGMAVRNCSSKRNTSITYDVLQYSHLAMIGTPISLALVLIQMHFQPEYVVFHPSGPLHFSALFHIAYSSASFHVLSLTDPLSHSIIKFASCALRVFTLAVIFGFNLSFYSICGTLSCVAGLLSYIQVTVKTESIRSWKPFFIVY